MDIQAKNSLRDMLRLAYRRKLLFLLAAATVATLVLVGAHMVPLKYTGKAVFEFGLEAAAEDISKTSADSFDAVKERLAHDIAGYQAMEQAVVEAGLTKGFPRDDSGALTYEGLLATQGLVGESMKNTEVVWEARSKQEDLVSVSFTHQDPKVAEVLTNILVKNYINQTYDKIRSGLKRQFDFLVTKVEDCDKLLEAAQRDKIRFETEHAGMLPDNPAAFQDKIDRSRVELAELQRRYEAARLRLVRVKALRQESATQPSTQIARMVRQPNPEHQRVSVQLQMLRDELDSSLILRHMTEEHPVVKSLRVKIGQTEKRLSEIPLDVMKEEIGGGPPVSLIDLTMESATAQSEMDSLGSEIKRLTELQNGYDKAWASFAPVRQDYMVLVKVFTDRQDEAKQWRGRLESVQVALAAAVDNRLTRLKAIQPAHQQFIPSSPSLLVVMVLAIGGALACGAGVVWAAQALDRSISTPEEAQEAFGLPVCGVIGEIISPHQRSRLLARRWLVTPAVALVLVAVLGAATISMVFRLRFPRQYNQVWTQATTVLMLGECPPPMRL
ncbi:MAG: hypothetical protein LLG01_19360 [Planctomycetaceae bacterium]|nr:hypothetical protein [Planctomycetaceae bacterium]